MRNMSFSETTEQVRNKTKTVTRRDGWWFLKPGDRVQAVEKAMGLKKGEKVKKLHVIEIVSVRPEQLNAILDYPYGETAKEGFPDMDAWSFVCLLRKITKKNVTHTVNRIEFRYLGGSDD